MRSLGLLWHFEIHGFGIDGTPYLGQVLCMGKQLVRGQLVILQQQWLVFFIELVGVIQQLPTVLLINLKVIVELLLSFDLWAYGLALKTTMMRKL